MVKYYFKIYLYYYLRCLKHCTMVFRKDFAKEAVKKKNYLAVAAQNEGSQLLLLRAI